jgi:hypothetical protein
MGVEVVAVVGGLDGGQVTLIDPFLDFFYILYNCNDAFKRADSGLGPSSFNIFLLF